MAIKALSQISHDGTIYAKGDVIDSIGEEQAKILVDSGSAEVVSETAGEDSKPKTAPTTPQVDNDPSGKRDTGTPPTGKPAEEQLLPESFTTPEGEYASVKNKNGIVYKYTFKGKSLKKDEYAKAYEESVAAAGEDSKPE